MEAVALCPTRSGNGNAELKVYADYPIPTPAHGEAVLKVIMAGICGTDLELLSGYKELVEPQIIGHEFVATIHSYAADVPATSRLPVGTRVVAEINCVPPGSKSRTAADRAQDPTRTAIGIFGRSGAFADHITVPVENLHVVPPNLSDEAAVFVEPVAAACQILEQLQLPRSIPVAVLGAGRLGWLVAHVLSACGSDVTVLSRGSNAERDEALAKAFHVQIGNLKEQKWAETFDVVVDCTGSADGFKTAVEIVNPRGTIVLKSTTAPGTGEGVYLTPIVVKEVKIVGSRCGPFPVALRLLERGAVDPSPLITCTFKRKDALAAFDKARSPHTLKVLLK